MAKIRNVSKNLASMEDLLQGKGVVTQTRGKESVDVHRIDVPFAVDTVEEMQALDVTRYTRANVYSDETTFVSYIYDPNATEGIAPNEGSGSWFVYYLPEGFTVSQLAAYTLPLGFVYTSSGFTISGDKGGATYKVVPADTGLTDGVLFIATVTGYQLQRIAIPKQVFSTVANAESALWLGIGDSLDTLEYSAGAGGAANYTVGASGTGVADGGLYHDMANGNQLQLTTNGVVTDRQFGITSDTVIDQKPQVDKFLNNITGVAKFTVADIRLASPVTVNNPELTEVVSITRTTMKPTSSNTGTGTLLLTFRTEVVFSGFVLDGDATNQVNLRNAVVGFQASGIHIRDCSFVDIFGIGVISV